MRTRFILPSLLCLLALTGCGTKTLTLSSFDGDKKATVTVEIADNASEREAGLMHRTSLAPDTGMLFVFTEPQMLTFWMKDTPIPLEILFFDAAGEFVNAISMEPCEADPCPQYKSAAASVYALEVNTGFRLSNGIGVGWKLDVKKVGKMAKAK